MSDFTGFEVPYENYSKLPHEFIDQLPNISSLAELKCVLYVLRHTWGFSQFDIKVRLTTDEIANGRKLKDGTRIDNGTGLSEPSIRSGVEQAVLHNFLDVEVDDSDRARIKKRYGVKTLRSEGKEFSPRGKKVYERTVKETNKRNSKKKSASPGGAGERRAKRKGSAIKEDSAHSNGAGEDPPIAPPPPKRSPLFEPLANQCFNFYELDGLDANSCKRVNMLVGWLKVNSPGATAETLAEFFHWYSQESRYKGLALPNHPDTFGPIFQEFKQAHLAKQHRASRRIPDTTPSPPLTEEERAATRQAIAEFRAKQGRPT